MSGSAILATRACSAGISSLKMALHLASFMKAGPAPMKPPWAYVWLPTSDTRPVSLGAAPSLPPPVSSSSFSPTQPAALRLPARNSSTALSAMSFAPPEIDLPMPLAFSISPPTLSAPHVLTASRPSRAASAFSPNQPAMPEPRLLSLSTAPPPMSFAFSSAPEPSSSAFSSAPEPSCLRLVDHAGAEVAGAAGDLLRLVEHAAADGLEPVDRATAERLDLVEHAAAERP